jgi:phosphatidylinositol-3-phosphatase
MRMRLAALMAAVPLLLGSVAAVTGATGAAATVSPATASGPCGTLTTAPAYSHVIVIMMENHSYNTIIGSSRAPYINSMAAECGLATNYHNISHPSLPNYMAVTSGLGYPKLKKFDTDCNPVPGCVNSAPGIFGQGETWAAYEESMPSNCDKSNAGSYAAHHDPPPYYTALGRCATNDVPFTRLATDLAAGTLPAYSFITPNLTDDMGHGTIADGDNWLSATLPTILGSPEYTDGSTVVFLTWDEGAGGSYAHGEHCATNTSDVSCHIATLVISPSTVPGTKSGALFNHYSLLATAEQLLGLPRLGKAASARTMTAAFNL